MTDLQQNNEFKSDRHDLESFVGLQNVQNHSNWFLGVGIALILLGIISIGASPFVTLASMLFFGALILAAGVVQTINAFKTRHGKGFLLNLLAGIFYSIIGILLIMHPAVGAITITLLLAAFYSVSGIFKIAAAATNRFANWGWVLFNGLVSLLLGILIWWQWPASGLFLIGLFIGIDLLMVGWVWVALALNAKSIGSAPK